MVNVPTFVEIPGFAGSGSRIQPPEPLYSNGYLPGQTLPAEYENFFLNGFSLNGLSEQVSIVSVVTELTNFLTAYGTTPNPALFNQFLTTMQAQLALKANLASPTFTGTVTIPAVPEPTIGSNPATKTYVDSGTGPLQSSVSALQAGLIAEAALARNADNLTSGTVPSARLSQRIQQFTASGTFNVPAGVDTVYITGCAAGGNGGAGSSGAGGGGGGSQGVKCIKKKITVTPGDAISVTIGAVGSDTTFGGLLTLVKGPNGSNGSGATGGAGAENWFGSGGNQGASGTKNTLKGGVAGSNSGNGGGGGGGGAESPLDSSLTGSNGSNGAGGSSGGAGGSGGGGGGGGAAAGSGGAGGAGGAGNAFGSGGGGGGGGNGGAAGGAGGNGGPAVLTIEW